MRNSCIGIFYKMGGGQQLTYQSVVCSDQAVTFVSACLFLMRTTEQLWNPSWFGWTTWKSDGSPSEDVAHQYQLLYQQHHCRVNITVWPQAWETAAIAVSTIKTFKFIVWLLSVHLRFLRRLSVSPSTLSTRKEESHFTLGPVEALAQFSVVGILCLSGILRTWLLLVATLCMGSFYLMK